MQRDFDIFIFGKHICGVRLTSKQDKVEEKAPPPPTAAPPGYSSHMGGSSDMSYQGPDWHPTGQGVGFRP